MTTSAGRVLLIDAEPRAAALIGSLRAKGLDVEHRREARGGLAAAIDWGPDCIVCNTTLPDIDGPWVARRLRTEPGAISTTPFVFLARRDGEDVDAVVHGLTVGGDVCMTEPFTEDEVAAQALALIEMARRLRARRDSFIDAKEAASSTSTVAFRGDLAQMPLATVLMILEMERRRGVLKVVTVGPRIAQLGVADSGFVSCSLDGVDMPAIQVVREVLRWKRGRVWFTAYGTAPKAAPRESIGAMLLESMRLDDEATVLAPDEVEIDIGPASILNPNPESKRG